MEAEFKFRSVCDECVTAKVKCNGKNPCERCAKRGIHCHYRPIKSRKSVKKDLLSSDANPNDYSEVDLMAQAYAENKGGQLHQLADYERKTWAVFFSLFKQFRHGCSAFWFRRQCESTQSMLLALSLFELTSRQYGKCCGSWKLDPRPEQQLPLNDYEAGFQLWESLNLTRRM